MGALHRDFLTARTATIKYARKQHQKPIIYIFASVKEKRGQCPRLYCCLCPISSSTVHQYADEAEIRHSRGPSLPMAHALKGGSFVVSADTHSRGKCAILRQEQAPALRCYPISSWEQVHPSSVGYADTFSRCGSVTLGVSYIPSVSLREPAPLATRGAYSPGCHSTPSRRFATRRGRLFIPSNPARPRD